MTHVFRIEDSNPYAKSIVDFLKTLDFVIEDKVDSISVVNKEKEATIKNIKVGLKEVELLKQGKLKTTSAKDFLNEL